MAEPTTPERDIAPISIEEEMRRSYLDYAMSVIVARAIPDVRDGLKPVHRRILHAMREGGYTAERPYRKSALIVGDVMGKYHPHGDQAIYDALVRMAQPFSMRLPLIDGQGNFGSMDSDPPAAMRYTEARLAKAAESLLDDIDRNTVDFQDNYDESRREPVVLPARYPNLLVNGAGGIAVGMATNIPPHNLGETVDACLALIETPDAPLEDIMALLPGPDFPTGALIVGRAGIHEAYRTGRGTVVMRARHNVEPGRNGRHNLVFTEIPYQVNKERVLEKIGDLARSKQIEGIAGANDESDREGVRLVVEVKRDADPEVVLNQLFRFTQLQSGFGINMLALNGGRPEQMGLLEVLRAFIAFREEIVVRRTTFLLEEARGKAHTLAGLAVAVANIDDIVALIRHAPDAAAARERLMARAWPAADVAPLIALIAEPGRLVDEDGAYRLSEAQARAILDLRLHRLTGLERDKIGADLRAIVDEIRDYLDILGSRRRVLDILRTELMEMRDAYTDPRRTAIEDGAFDQDIEDLIQREDMVLTFTHGGYIKRVPLATYRAQKRGGKGRAGMKTGEEDFVARVDVVNTHTPVLFFSSSGMVYKLKVYRLPLGTPQARGKAMVNMLPLQSGETISIILPLPDEAEWPDLDIMLATSSGTVRRNSLADFVNVKANGKIAMKLEDGESLVGVETCDTGQDVLLATGAGKAIRFPVGDVRRFSGRDSRGVRGVRLAAGDRVISLSILDHVDAETETRDEYVRIANAHRRAGLRIEQGNPPNPEDAALAARIVEPPWSGLHAAEEFVLTVADDGFGKRTSAYEYRITGRGGGGLAAMDLERNGGDLRIVGAFPVRQDDGLILVTNGGQIIRVPVGDIRIAGRATRGVTLFRLDADERVVSVTRLRDAAEEPDPAEPEAADPRPAGEAEAHDPSA